MLDRFSITLQLERRVVLLPEVPVEDRQQWPSVTLHGVLPRLVVHVNEQKVHALKNLVTSMHNYYTPPTTPAASNRTCNEEKEPSMGLPSSDTMTNILDATATENQQDTSMVDDNKLVIIQFTIDKMSLELQSRGRCIAELQVTGVKANLNKRQYDLSAALSIHSLLIADALQTFGPDFELLVASHKHIR